MSLTTRRMLYRETSSPLEALTTRRILYRETSLAETIIIRNNIGL